MLETLSGLIQMQRMAPFHSVSQEDVQFTINTTTLLKMAHGWLMTLRQLQLGLPDKEIELYRLSLEQAPVNNGRLSDQRSKVMQNYKL